MDNENKDINMEETPIGIKPLEGTSETVTTLNTNPADVVEPRVEVSESEPTNEIKLVRTQSIPVQTEAPIEEEVITPVGIVNNPEPKKEEKKKTSISDIIMYIIMIVIIIIIILLLLKFCEDGRNDGKGIVTTTKAGEKATTTTTIPSVVTNPTTQLTTDPTMTQTTTGTTTKKVNKDTTTTTRPKTNSTKKTTTKKPSKTEKPQETTEATTTKPSTTKKPDPEYTYTYENFLDTFYKVTVYKNGKVLTDRYCIMDSSGQVPLQCGPGTVDIDLDDIDFTKHPTITIAYESTGELHKVVQK